MYETIEFDVLHHVARITLNRPDAMNAFTEQMHKELIHALQATAKDPEIRCIVLTGAGKAFNAGQDLKEVSSTQVDFGEFLRNRYNPLILQMQQTEKPIIAAINGVAAGAGMSLALACDIRLASEQAVFANVFINIGLVPDSGGCFFLPRIVGIGKALELAFTGEKISAAEALRIGLVNKVYAVDTFTTEVMEYAGKLAKLPTKTIGLIKRTMYSSLHMNLQDTLEHEAIAQDIAGHSEDYQEGVKAFLEKRAPDFKGR
jgi:2-(1,2-epoxy-1,2-dihydrophenyl)acetyl-CoA isomerase